MSVLNKLTPRTLRSRTIACTAAHLFLSMAMFVTVMGIGMRHFDAGTEPTFFENTLAFVVKMLMHPGMALWPFLRADMMPWYAEWLLILANSALWGFAIATVWTGWVRWRKAPLG